MARPSLLSSLRLALTATAPAHARRVDSWPSERLLREADLVVVARPVSSSDSGMTATDNFWKSE